MARFTVDTHLFRELGELLVGRSSTALIELIKNAYDADATLVQVSAADLAKPARGTITVVDDGVGMTEDEFTNGFLRIAGRGKQEGTRRSLQYQRRFTGAKGIGRLAAHKLARELDVTSIPSDDKLDGSPRYQVRAAIDWDAIEAKETLDQASDAIRVSTKRLDNAAGNGTTIRLRRLRRAWTPTERQLFYTEVATFRPPDALAGQLSSKVLPRPLVFVKPKVRDNRATDPGFDVVLEGELGSGDDPWAEFAEASNWILEIAASRAGVIYAVAPTTKMLQSRRNLRAWQTKTPHPAPKEGPFFQARVFIREGQPPSAMRQVIRQASGVRIYMEGFRVLPYGEAGNDWLGVARDYSVRTPGGLQLEGVRFGKEAFNEGFIRPTNEQLYGAVFLLERNATSLRMLVNREGFVPEAGYEHLVTIMRNGVNLSTRVRAAATEKERRERADARDASKEERKGQEAEESRLRAAQAKLEESLAEAVSAAAEADRAAARGDIEETRRALGMIARQLSTSSSATEELSAEQGLLRVLASVGTQMAAFIHELNRILENVAALEELIGREGTPRLRRLIGDVRRSLERQASYLVDVIGPDTRRRRSRQRIADRVDVGWRFVADAAAARGITLDTRVPPDLKMLPMFPAETAAIFTNLFSNAVKAAGRGGRIRVSARDRNGSIVIRIENTGRAVSVANSERWFEPFQSTTTQVDAMLGQGLGLGLPITREILAQYGANIRFVTPAAGFRTALEIKFP